MKYPVTLNWQPKFNEFLQLKRIFLAFPLQIEGVIKIGDEVTFTHRVLAEPYASMPRGGFMSTGAFSYSNSRLGQATQLGRYCSLANDIRQMGVTHPSIRVTTSPLTYGRRYIELIRREIDPAFPLLEFDDRPKPVIIGNNVWIGEGVLLKGGITIGDGAIIGARAVVTRDVPPFSVAAGNPARVRKLRFTEATVERLISVRWWDYSFKTLPHRMDDIEWFLGDTEDGIAAGSIVRFDSAPIELAAELAKIAASH